MACRLALPLLAFLLLLGGCATTPDSIIAPDLAGHLHDARPVRLVTPLATIYQQSRWDDQPVISPDRNSRLAGRIMQALAASLAKRGWKVAEAPTVSWPEMEAGSDLAQVTALPDEPRPRAAIRSLRQLDRMGRQLRLHERIEGVRQAERGLHPSDTALLGDNAGSLLFAVAVGCDGRLAQGPCREIQSPPIHDPDFPLGILRTLSRGMALHLYWVDAASGKLLWYDTTRTFNADPDYQPDIATMVNDTLAEFPPPP
ncbi:MAG: hypothetical protein OEV91_04590 [Desulfobulbaceae bacterium]|nr:hypothetical protein [Desulfobulbaceae bacterium]